MPDITDERLQELHTEATADENAIMQQNMIRLLQQRVVGLNVEVRVRDERIAELEAELERLENPDRPE